MKRMSLLHFIMIGLLFWGLPGAFIGGWRAVLYTLIAVATVGCFAHWKPKPREGPQRSFGTTTCTFLVVGALTYLVLDALFGQKLFRENLFLFGSTAVSRVVTAANQGVGQGRGLAGLLGTITTLLPFAMVDVAQRGPRRGRWVLWGAALLLLFYDMTTSRGRLLLAVMAIVLAKSSNWRRVALAGVLALAAFSVASMVRGDYAHAHSPLIAGLVFPYINLGLLIGRHCGSASWYSYVTAFLMKFVPSFIYPKKVFSFNVEMTLCIYPSLSGNISSISVFTWLGEMFYYHPSALTALMAGLMAGGMGWLVDWQLVKSRLYSARIYAGFMCIMLPRSRVMDLLSFLIAQMIFLMVWPYISGLARSLRIVVPFCPSGPVANESQEGAL